MESIFSSEITIPLFEVILLLILSTIAFLFGRLKLAILINYCFTVYWGYILNFNIFTDHAEYANECHLSRTVITAHEQSYPEGNYH
jgi:hypothetical protein